MQNTNDLSGLSGFKRGEIVDRVLRLLEVETADDDTLTKYGVYGGRRYTGTPQELDELRFRSAQAIDTIMGGITSWAASGDSDRIRAYSRLARTVELHRNRRAPKDSSGNSVPPEWSSKARSFYGMQEDTGPVFRYPKEDGSAGTPWFVTGGEVPTDPNEKAYYEFLQEKTPSSAYARGLYDQMVDEDSAGSPDITASIVTRLGLDAGFLESMSPAFGQDARRRAQLYSKEARLDEETGRRFIDVTDESGNIVEAVQVPDFSSSRTFSVTLADGTEKKVSLGPSLASEIAVGRGQGFWGDTILGGLYHQVTDDTGRHNIEIQTPYGKRPVPIITGNAAVDAELYNRPEWQRGIEEIDYDHGFMWNAGKTLVGTLEYVGLDLATRGVLGKAGGLAARAGRTIMAGNKMAPFAKTTISALGKAAMEGGRVGSKLVPKAIAAPGLRFSMRDLGGEIYYDYMTGLANGNASLLESVDSGTDEWFGEYVFGSMARGTRRIGGLFLRGDMGRTLSQKVGLNLTGVAEDGEMFRQGLDIFHKMRGEVAEKQLSAIQNGMYGVVGRTWRTEAAAQFADTAFVGYMFGRYSAAQINAAKDGKSWDRMSLAEKTSYFGSVDLMDSHAMGSMVGMLGGQATFTTAQLRGANPFRSAGTFGEQLSPEEVRTQVKNMAEFQLTAMNAMGEKADQRVVHMMGRAFDIYATPEERAAVLDEVAKAAREKLTGEVTDPMAGSLRAGDISATIPSVSDDELLDLVSREGGEELLVASYARLTNEELEQQHDRLRTSQAKALADKDHDRVLGLAELRVYVQNEQQKRVERRSRGEAETDVDTEVEVVDYETPEGEKVDGPFSEEVSRESLPRIDTITDDERKAAFRPGIRQVQSAPGAATAGNAKFWAVIPPKWRNATRATKRVEVVEDTTGREVVLSVEVDGEALPKLFPHTTEGLKQAMDLALVANGQYNANDDMLVEAGRDPETELGRLLYDYTPQTAAGKLLSDLLNKPQYQNPRRLRKLQTLDKEGGKAGKGEVAPGDISKLLTLIRGNAVLNQKLNEAWAEVDRNKKWDAGTPSQEDITVLKQQARKRLKSATFEAEKALRERVAADRKLREDTKEEAASAAPTATTGTPAPTPTTTTTPAAEEESDWEKAVKVIINNGRGGTAILTKELGIGYKDALALLDRMTAEGILGPSDGNKAREVLLTLDQWKSRKTEAPSTSPTSAPTPATTAGTPLSVPTPDAQRSIDAQIEAMLEGVSPKNVVFVPVNSKWTGRLPKGVKSVSIRGIGTLLTTDEAKATQMRGEVRRGQMTEERLGEYLFGIKGGKPADATHVTQVVNNNGIPIAEIATGPSNQADVDAAVARIARGGTSTRPGDTVRRVPIEQALFERQVSEPSKDSITDFENRWLEFMDNGKGNPDELVKLGRRFAVGFRNAARTAASEAERNALNKRADEHEALVQAIVEKQAKEKQDAAPQGNKPEGGVEQRPETGQGGVPPEAGGGDRPVQGEGKEELAAQERERLVALLADLEKRIAQYKDQSLEAIEQMVVEAETEFLRELGGKLSPSLAERARKAALARVARMKEITTTIEDMVNRMASKLKDANSRPAPISARYMAEAHAEIVDNLAVVEVFSGMSPEQRLLHFLPPLADIDKRLLDAVVRMSKHLNKSYKTRLKINDKPARNTDTSTSSQRAQQARAFASKQLAEVLIMAAGEAGVPVAGTVLANAAADADAELARANAAAAAAAVGNSALQDMASVQAGFQAFSTVRTGNLGQTGNIYYAQEGPKDARVNKLDDKGNPIPQGVKFGPVGDLVESSMLINIEAASDNAANRKLDGMIAGAVLASGIRSGGKATSKQKALVAAVLGVPVERVEAIAAGLDSMGAANDAVIDAIVMAARNANNKRLISDEQIDRNRQLLRSISITPTNLIFSVKGRSGNGGMLKSADIKVLEAWWKLKGRNQSVEAAKKAMVASGNTAQIDNAVATIDAMWQSRMDAFKAIASERGTNVRTPVATLASLIGANLGLPGGQSASLSSPIDASKEMTLDMAAVELATNIATKTMPLNPDVIRDDGDIEGEEEGDGTTKELDDKTKNSPGVGDDSGKTEEEKNADRHAAYRQQSAALWAEIRNIYADLDGVLAAINMREARSGDPAVVTRRLREIRNAYARREDGSLEIRDTAVAQFLFDLTESATVDEQGQHEMVDRIWSATVKLHAKSQELMASTAAAGLPIDATAAMRDAAAEGVDLMFDLLEYESGVRTKDKAAELMGRVKASGLGDRLAVFIDPDTGKPAADDGGTTSGEAPDIKISQSVLHEMQLNMFIQMSRVLETRTAPKVRVVVRNANGTPQIGADGNPVTKEVDGLGMVYMWAGLPVTGDEVRSAAKRVIHVLAAAFSFSTGFHHRVLSGRINMRRMDPTTVDDPTPWVSPRWWVDRINNREAERLGYRGMSTDQLMNNLGSMLATVPNFADRKFAVQYVALRAELKRRAAALKTSTNPTDAKAYKKLDSLLTSSPSGKIPNDTLIERAAAGFVSRWQRWNILARGSRGLGTKNVLEKNRATMAAQFESGAKTQLILTRIQQLMAQLREWNVSNQDAALLGSMLEAGAVVRFRNGAELETALGRPGTAKYYQHMVEWNQLMVDIGKEMVSVGLISPEQFEMEKNHHLPRKFVEMAETIGGDKAFVVTDSNYSGSTVASAEMPRSSEASADGTTRIFDIRYVMPLSVGRVAKRLETFRVLQRMRAEGLIVNKNEWEAMGAVEREQFTKLAEKGLTQNLSDGSLIPTLTNEERKLKEEGKLSPVEAEEILKRRSSSKLEQVVLQTFIDEERSARTKDGGPTMTAPMKELLDDLENGYITWHASRELSFLVERNDLKPDMGAGRLEEASRAVQQLTLTWRQLKTVQNPKHWFQQFTTNLVTNSMTGKVPMSDMFESILTGEGTYADAAWHITEWQEFKKNNIPKKDWTEGAKLFDETVMSIGGATLSHMISDPVSGADVINSMFYGADGQPLFVSSSGSSAETDLGTIAGALNRSGRGWANFTKRVTELTLSPNPAARAEAVRSLVGVYNLHELWWKHAAIIEAKKLGMDHQTAVRWASEGTGDFSDRNTTLLRLTTQFQIAPTRLQRAAYKKIDAGNARLLGKQLITLGAASPFWMYRASMFPTMVKHTLSWRGITHTAVALLGIRLVSQAFGGDDEDMREAAAGTDVLKGVDTSPDTLNILRRRHGDAPLPNFGGGWSPSGVVLTLRDWADYLLGFGQNLLHVASMGTIGKHSQAGEMLTLARGPSMGGESSVLDFGEYVPMVGRVNDISAAMQGNAYDWANDFLMAQSDGRLGFGMFSMAATAGVVDALKLWRGEEGKSRGQVMAEVALGVAQEFSAPLGGTGMFGPGFSREMMSLAENTAFGQRSFGEWAAGLPTKRTPSTFAEMLQAQAAKSLMPMRKIPTASQSPASEQRRKQSLTGDSYYAGPESSIEEEAAAKVRDRQIEQTCLNLLSRAYKETLDQATIPHAMRVEAYLNLNYDLRMTPDGYYDVVDRPLTEIGKWLKSKGDSPHERQLWVDGTMTALKRRASIDSLLSGADGLVYRKDVDPALHDRIVRAAWRSPETKTELLRLLWDQMKNTKGNEGVLSRMWIASGLADMKPSGGDLDIWRRSREFVNEHSNGTYADMDMSHEERAQIMGSAVYDVSPTTAVQSLPMKGAGAQAARFLKSIKQ